jgi:uncharacterized membrane protein YjjP (DUF1212 family)
MSEIIDNPEAQSNNEGNLRFFGRLGQTLKEHHEFSLGIGIGMAAGGLALLGFGDFERQGVEAIAGGVLTYASTGPLIIGLRPDYFQGYTPANHNPTEETSAIAQSTESPA